MGLHAHTPTHTHVFNFRSVWGGNYWEYMVEFYLCREQVFLEPSERGCVVGVAVSWRSQRENIFIRLPSLRT